MTSKEAAARLGVSLQTVHNLVRRGKLTPINPANPVLERPARLLFNRADVEALKHQRNPAAD